MACPHEPVNYEAGKLRAIAFGYACHNTTLSSVTVPPEEPSYLFNGDYAGFAQERLQQAYPVQVVTLGNAVTLAALGSETIVDYALRLKGEIKAPLVWVAGYSNDYAGYVPSHRVAVEGGYEAANDFTLDVEDRIVGKVHDLLRALEEASR
jgi:hypothetical protein